MAIVCIALLAWLIGKAVKGTPFSESGPCMVNPRAFRREGCQGRRIQGSAD
ncbi:MAG: hypothetical protein LBN96_01380 [Desulfovibrio sp.]|nr:hypothetical protein [Desulfovibrio sp.]